MNVDIGYDLELWQKQGLKVPISIPVDAHSILVGGSGSGKSTLLLLMLYRMKKACPCELVICDFKASKELEGISDSYAEFEACYEQIKRFYDEIFLNTPEGGSGKSQFLIIDEIAGLISHFDMSKQTKPFSDTIRQIMANILMLGRSRKIFLILVMQRYSAGIFPSATGAIDNMAVACGLGKLNPDAKRGLFSGEILESDDLQFGMGKGIILVDGKPLRGLQVPIVSKEKLLKALRKMSDN